MTSRLEQLVERFAEGRNTRFAKLLETNEARIRSYLTGAVQPKYDFLEAVSEKLGVSIDWLISGEGRMLRAENRAEREAKKKAHRELEQEGLPVFDCDFTCGFDDVENDQTARPSYFMDTTFNRQADLWCSVQGRSMLPDLEPGDKIALRRVTIDNLEPGHIYAVVLDGLRTVKILRRVPEDPTMLDFVASNPEYGTERYPINRILHLYKVVGKLHAF